MQIDGIVKFLLPLALFIIMLGMGLSLSLSDFRRVLLYPRAVLVGIFCQMVLLPAVGVLVITVLHVEPEVAVGLLVLSFCPGGTTSNMFAYLFKGDVALSITLTALVSLLAPFTVPVLTHYAMLELLGAGRSIELPVLQTILQLLVITAVPVALGMLIFRLAPRITQRLDRPVRILSIVFLFLVILSIVYANRAEMGGYFVEAGAASLLLNLISLVGGFAIAAALRLRRDQAITISFEVGIQNGTTALLVTGVLLGVPAMTIAPVTYSLLMFGSGTLFGLLFNLTINREVLRDPVSERLN